MSRRSNSFSESESRCYQKKGKRKKKHSEIIIVASGILFSNKYSLSAYHFPGTILEIWGTSVNKTDRGLCPEVSLHFNGGKKW